MNSACSPGQVAALAAKRLRGAVATTPTKRIRPQILRATAARPLPSILPPAANGGLAPISTPVCTTCWSRACAAPWLCRVIRNSRGMVLCYQFDDAPNLAIELVQLVGRDQVFPVTRASDLMLWVSGQERRVNVEASDVDVGVDGGLFLRTPDPGDLGRIFVVQRCLEDGLPWW